MLASPEMAWAATAAQRCRESPEALLHGQVLSASARMTQDAGVNRFVGE